MKSTPVKLFVLAIYMVNVVLCSENCYEIIIIGAGPAGIEAAIHLNQYEFTNFTILEAESYLGGFIKTESRNSTNGIEYIIEHGDQWIIDQALPDPTGDGMIISSISFKKNQKGNEVPFIFSNGTELPEGARHEAHNFLMGIYKKDGTHENETLSLSEYVIETSASTGSGNLSFVQEEINRFYENFILTHAPIGDWDSLSYAEFFEAVSSGVILNYIKGGLRSLFTLSIDDHFDEGSQKFPDFNVEFQKVVQRIDYSGPNVIVTTNDSVQYTAKKIIVTTPLGALKSSYSTLFHPVLSTDKQLAIDNLNVSYHEKALLEFDDVWWPKDFSYYQLWTNDDYRQLFGGREWLATLLGFSVVDENPKMLVAYFKGPNARLLKDVSDNTFESELLKLLRKSWRHRYNISDPVGFYRTNWSGNQRFLGGFSYRNKYSYMTTGSIDVLAIPVADKIYFAGEHTIDRNWGTLIGDKESGVTVAKQIRDSFKRIKNV